METTVSNAIELQETLGEDILTPIDPLSMKPPLINEKELNLDVLHLMSEIGFEVHPTPQAPFDAISEDRDRTKILTGSGKKVSSVRKRAKIMSSISYVTGTMSAIIIEERSKEENIENTAILEEKEVEKISNTDEFLKLLLSRAGSHR